jgi:hypothetical protein
MALRTRIGSALLAAALCGPGIILTNPGTADAQTWYSRASRADIVRADREIRRAYLDILGREPDASGLASYRRHMLSEGWSAQDVRQALRRSDERRASGYGYNSRYVRRAGNYGAYGFADNIVRQAYRDVLRREPDAAGMHDYGLRVTRDGWSLDDVERALRNSPEYRNRFGRY